MDERQWLAEKFEGDRARLRGVAYRMLGSLSEAEDAVQETWLRLDRSDTSAVQNLSGWLTRVVANVCMDMLRSRKALREDAIDSEAAEPVAPQPRAIDPEQETLLAESVGLAVLVVLDTLVPAERLAFVLHDMFNVSFDEIAPIVGRSPEAARQLASRARRRVRGAEIADADRARHRRIAETFVAALRAGDFNALLAIVDPDLTVRADTPGAREVRGAARWAKGAIAYVQAMGVGRPVMMLVDGAAGLVHTERGRLSRVLRFTIEGEKIRHIEVITQPSRLDQLKLAVLTD